MLNIFIVDFLIIFLIVYLFYVLYLNKKKINYDLLSDSDQIKLFVKRYKINIDRINYKYLLNVISMINSFILSFACSVVLRIDNILLSICVSFIIIFSLIFILFEIAGRYFKKIEGKVKVVKTKKKKKIKKKEDE